MLEKSERAGFPVRCDRCRRAADLVEAADAEVARALLAARGWLECARRGRGRERWDWWCPQCAPRPPTTSGRTT
jgi:hypothetical protein